MSRRCRRSRAARGRALTRQFSLECRANCREIRVADKDSENGMARTARKLRVRADYLIVGGGMAGISALTEARRRGIYAICLEAHTKPGGRIRTVRKQRVAHYPVELGAEFVHGRLMKRLCESLGLTLIRHPSDGAAFVDQEFRPLLPIL